MGLLLRPDAYYAESAEGVYILTHGGPVSLTGSSVHQWIDRLAPYLDGRFSLPQLTADLSQDRKERVHELIGMLGDRGVVRETDGTPGRAEGEYRHEISFVDYFLDGGARRVAAYQDRRALVVGAGEQVVPLAVAALRSGLRRVAVAMTAETPSDRERLEAAAARARRDPSQRLDVLGLEGESAHVLGEVVRGADLVFHVSDRPRPDRARLLERRCRESGALLAQAMPWAGELWLTVTGPDAPAGCGWTSGLRRLAARHPAGGGAPPEPGGGCAELAASRLVHQVFLEVTGVSPADPYRMVRIDMATLRSDTHVVLPHPFSNRSGPAGPGARSVAEDLASRPALDPEEFSRRAAACADDRPGLFGPPTEHRFTQLPLQVCTMEVADPVGLAGSTVDVFGAGLDFVTARHNAALRAFAAYASLMVDPRRLLNSAGGPLVTAADDPEDALTALRDGRLAGYVRAYGLDGEPAGLLDAAPVFPLLRRPAGPDPGALVPAAGTAAAYSWRDAVEAGLLGQCRRLALADLATGPGQVRRIPLDRVELDATGRRYRAIIEAIGGDTAIHDVTGRLGVPTVVCEVGAAAGAASGRSLGTAVRDSMGAALLRHQALVNDEPAYSPPPPPPLPHPPALPPPPADIDGGLLERPPLDLADIVAALAGRALAPRAVPLDHDPEVSAVMPYIVSVELAHV